MFLRVCAIAIAVAALVSRADAEPFTFVRDVQPILRARCWQCHATGNEEAGLNLAIGARAAKGGDSGTAILPGRGAESLLVKRIAAANADERMPPEGEALSEREVATLRAWIDQGAAWPAAADVQDVRLERAKHHWAFQPLREVALPDARSNWARNPIDRFILAKLEAKSLRPAGRANSRTLVRRAYMDVIGLPPAAEAVESFASDQSEAAWDDLVDRLLASPRHGERWGRHWLDVARYADSSGQEGDQDRPHAWRYRDFVIRSLNEDFPFDTFLRWQIAGDELEPGNDEAAIATGFLVAGPHTVLENTFLEEELLRNRYNELDDMLSTLGSGMLGLTIGCARCHDHKYDAISAREYYGMLAALHSGDRKEVKLRDGKEAFVFRDAGSKAAPTWNFKRGDFRDRTEKVELGFVNVLMRGKTIDDFRRFAGVYKSFLPPQANSTYQRSVLAYWMTDTDGGAGALAARVIVNRVWQHHFGAGLVRTPSDFGVRGEAPTHPELLEWLASDFVRGGWRLKRLHRMILTSATYQQSGALTWWAKVDPENRLLHRMRPRRIEAEILRDAMLATSGSLNLAAHGPAFKPPITGEAMIARNLKSPYPDKVADGPENHRRTIYMFHKRVIPYPLLAAFDRPDSLQSCGRREGTTVAPQALALLNDPFVRARAIDFAGRLIAEGAKTNETGDEFRIQRAFEIAFGRRPKETEMAASRGFLESQTARRRGENKSTPDEQARRLALADFCQSLFGANEFIYVD